MKAKRPTEKEDRDNKLHYAFNSLLNVTQIITFKSAKKLHCWLERLLKEGVSHEVTGILIEPQTTYILLHLRKSVHCYGEYVPVNGRLWCQINKQNKAAVRRYLSNN